MSEIKWPVWWLVVQGAHVRWFDADADREELALLRAVWRATEAMENNARRYHGETTYRLEDVSALADARDAVRAFYAAHPEAKEDAADAH